jgi:hypothetical protein
MKHALHRVIAIVVAAVLAVPASAQSGADYAKKGDLVVVVLRDGHEIAGRIGDRRHDGDFYVNAPYGPPTLVRLSEVKGIRDAKTGATLEPPLPGHGISTQNKVLIGIGVGVGVALAGFLYFRWQMFAGGQ